MSSRIPVFLIGATGYIGGTVLCRLLAHSSANVFDITALIRSEDKAKGYESFGVKPVVGSWTDLALVERLAEQAHIVFSLACSDQLDVTRAILRGLKSRHAKLGDLPILIHTSGTGVLTEGAMTSGMYPTDVIYDDSDFEQLAKIKPTARHRNVDLAVIDADEQGYCWAYIVLPSTVYGIAKTPLVDAGLQNAYSLQIPRLIKASLDRGRAGMVGKGLALKPDIHIDDTADLYIILYDAIASRGPENVDHGSRGYYFGENGEHSWYDISNEIGHAMVPLGLCGDEEPTAFPEAELIKYFGSVEMGMYWGANSRARGTHSRSLGWQPKYTKEDMIRSIRPELEVFLKERTVM
ncbi:nucleoside-diphosphate-sugar epimerase-like protein [Phanerochaete sordida]|uniref:Nucleoside-diphosphate-sugar epimerase-like protein n=1 Tax=Phanerochaete sordida TaxID=48140 RepID=A0A9P3G6X3_9APHY|nr:nucleoside-diphosphate-sugar epimerase-like protein [Phanerochaete sordida]